MNSFNTDEDTQTIIKKYQSHNVTIKTFNQSRFPRVFKDSLLPVPKNVDDTIDCWYPLATVICLSLSPTLVFSTNSLPKARNTFSSLTSITWVPSLISTSWNT